MASLRRALLSIVGLLASVSTAWTQSTSSVTQDDHLSRGGFAIGITLQDPADVNQPPLCQKLYVPCLSPNSAPDFGVVASAVGYLTKSLGVVGVGPQWSSIGSIQPAIQPGIGAEAHLHAGVTLQFEYDYRWAPDDRRDLSTGRALVAIVFPVGSRE